MSDISQQVEVIKVVPAGPGIFWSLERMGQALDLSKTKIGELVNTPGFPQPIRIGHPRWVSQEVVDWYVGQRDSISRRRKRV